LPIQKLGFTTRDRLLMGWDWNPKRGKYVVDIEENGW